MNLARRWPVATFGLLAIAFTWALLPLAERSVLASLAALLGPAFAATVTAAGMGPGALRELRDRVTHWRLAWRWYALALLLPLPVSALRSALESVAGAEGPIRLQPVSALGLIVFVLVAGEEIGWRGFALPHLLARTGPWTASTIVALLWSFWHLPLFFMPGMPQFGTPFVSYVPYLAALSLLLTRISLATGASVPVATLFHGAVNTFGVVNLAASATLRGWTNAIAYGLAAVVLVGLARRRSR